MPWSIREFVAEFDRLNDGMLWSFAGIYENPEFGPLRFYAIALRDDDADLYVHASNIDVSVHKRLTRQIEEEKPALLALINKKLAELGQTGTVTGIGKVEL